MAAASYCGKLLWQATGKRRFFFAKKKYIFFYTFLGRKLEYARPKVGLSTEIQSLAAE
jgi:hypothetical protein